jgi:undecaprenyl diphosphate synthase
MNRQSTELLEKTPNHVAIIMDGNGRWATRRGLPRQAGHRQGAEAARRVVRAATEMGIRYITLFGFSSENWNRPKDEIQELMKLLRFYLRSETAELHKNGARLRVIGDRSALDDDIVRMIETAEELTAKNEKITVVMAINYGGRSDIAQAAQRMMKAYEGQPAPDLETISKEFSGFLMTGDIPDPDLLIRTSGEQRISNFLLWQMAYTEFVFSETLWPDFAAEDLAQALREYAARDRRFGGVKAASAAT